MFRYFKAKRAEAEFKAVIWGKVFDLVNNMPDIVELAKKTKDMDQIEFQKEMAKVIVDYMKANEVSHTEDDKAGE